MGDGKVNRSEEMRLESAVKIVSNSFNPNGNVSKDQVRVVEDAKSNSYLGSHLIKDPNCGCIQSWYLYCPFIGADTLPCLDILWPSEIPISWREMGCSL